MPSLPPLNRSLPIALIRARERIMTPIRSMLAETGLTEQQWRVLRVLHESGAQDALQVADRACIRPPSLSRIARTLSDKGLVSQRTSQRDRRRQTLTITEAGVALIDDLTPRAVEIAQALRARLGAERLNDLLDALEHLAAIDEDPPR